MTNMWVDYMKIENTKDSYHFFEEERKETQNMVEILSCRIRYVEENTSRCEIPQRIRV